MLDATRCLSYWSQAPHPVPEAYRAEMGAAVYGCDICQDVCPWNRGVEKRRAGLPPAADARADGLARGLARPGGGRRRRATTGCTCRATTPGGSGATPSSAFGNTCGVDDLDLLEPWEAGDDPMLAEAAAWARARVEERGP